MNVTVRLSRLLNMDKLLEMFEEDRQIMLLVFLFLVMLGVCLHLHGHVGAPDESLKSLTQWAREATAGILAAILIKVSPIGKRSDGK